MKLSLGVFVALSILSCVEITADDLRPQEGVATIRERIGEVFAIDHTDAQLRAGYILHSSSGENTDSDAVAIGGHLHLETKRYRGVLASAALYTVQDMGIQKREPQKIDPDFFGTKKEGFSTLSQTYLDALWGSTRIVAGRQMLNTPHADSDDIRMMPNYFMAYTVSNNYFESLTIGAGKILQMAGWENGGEPGKFINVQQAFGAESTGNGIYYLSALYNGVDDSVLQAWYYHIADIADLVYLEGAKELYSNTLHTVIALQYESAIGTGERLLGGFDSYTWGTTIQLNMIDSGLFATLSFNRTEGEGGAFGSLGGGPFFTSLEELTIDTIGSSGYAWITSLSYNISPSDIQGVRVGFAYGEFNADDKNRYESAELDLTFNYALTDRLDLAVACAFIDDRRENNEDYTLARVILNYNFINVRRP